jgi:adenylylsulfate kinase
MRPLNPLPNIQQPPDNQARPGRPLFETTGRCYWLTGLSGAGKTTLAEGFQRVINGKSPGCIVLDGDEVRAGLNNDLGFSRSDRRENVRRLAEIAKLLVSKGFYVIVSAISPYREDRRAARQLFEVGKFFEVYVSADLATCIARDTKRLYQKAREGRITDLTGIDAPYEPPLSPELTIDTSHATIIEAIELLVATVNR